MTIQQMAALRSELDAMAEQITNQKAEIDALKVKLAAIEAGYVPPPEPAPLPELAPSVESEPAEEGIELAEEAASAPPDDWGDDGEVGTFAADKPKRKYTRRKV